MGVVVTSVPGPCRRTRLAVTPYLDGRLPAEHRARVQDHLKRCSACLGEFRATLELARVARVLPRRLPRPDLAEQVWHELGRRRSIETRTLDPGRDRARLRWVAALVAVALAAFVAGWLFEAFVSGVAAPGELPSPTEEARPAPSRARDATDPSTDDPTETRFPRGLRPIEPASDHGRSRRYR
jgi:anti-sigma factor RsiW